MRVKSPWQGESVFALEGALKCVILCHRAIGVNDEDSIVRETYTVLRADTTKHKLDHVIQDPDSHRSVVGQVDLEKRSHPLPILRRRCRYLPIRQSRVIAV